MGMVGPLEFWKQIVSQIKHKAMWYLRQSKVPELSGLQGQDLRKIRMLGETMSKSVEDHIVGSYDFGAKPAHICSPPEK